jgi:hypothetical protein
MATYDGNTYECRPGGSCPYCNPAPEWCSRCTEVVVENRGEVCDDCAALARECGICGSVHDDDGAVCSTSCAQAAESEGA